MLADIHSAPIPSEVVDLIICLVSDVPTLLSCSVVSRRFCVPSQAQIFRYVGREPTPGSAHTYKSRMENFGTLISKSSSIHLRKLVQTIRLKDVLLKEPASIIFKALVLLPNINTLVLAASHSFMWSCISPLVLSTLEKTVFPRLCSLTVRRFVEVPFPRLFEQCPLLETLEVVRCNLWLYGSFRYRNPVPHDTPKPGCAPLGLSLRHLKLWGVSLNEFSYDPEWIALNTGLVKSLTIGQGILDGPPEAKNALTKVFEKNRNSLEVVQVLNDSFGQNMELLGMIYHLPNLKLLVIHMHWSVRNQKWNFPPSTSQILQRLAQILMDPSFTVPTVHLLLSNINPVDWVLDGFDAKTRETWAPFDSAICARPDMQLILSLRETESERQPFDEMKVHIQECLPRSLEARLLEIRQYHGALGGSWDMSDERDEPDEMWDGIV